MRNGKYTKKTAEQRKEEIETLVKGAEKRVAEYFESPENLKEYLDFMAGFYGYSINNQVLIEEQFTGASAVGSFMFWSDKGYRINKGERVIKILVPIKNKAKFQWEGEWIYVNNATERELALIKSGVITVKQEMYFKLGNVFDISQTNASAEDLPKIFPNKWLEGDTKNYYMFYKAALDIANEIHVKILNNTRELGVSKGVTYTGLRAIELNRRNGELQNFKTVIHELAHARLHSNTTLQRGEKEFQAEMVAYTVCSYFGIDTSEYSMGYIHAWSKNIEETKSLLTEIRSTVLLFTEIIEKSILNQVKQQVADIEESCSAREALVIFNSSESCAKIS